MSGSHQVMLLSPDPLDPRYASSRLHIPTSTPMVDNPDPWILILYCCYSSSETSMSSPSIILINHIPRHGQRHSYSFHILLGISIHSTLVYSYRLFPWTPKILIIFQGADIEQVIQFSVPPSLLVWMQCAGHAGQCTGLNAQALLFIEKSMFELHKKKWCKTDTTETLDFDMDEDELESDLKECENEIDDEREFKKVEPALCEWIETEGCQQDVADRYFNNPPHRLCKCYLFISYSSVSFHSSYTCMLWQLMVQPSIATPMQSSFPNLSACLLQFLPILSLAVPKPPLPNQLMQMESRRWSFPNHLLGTQECTLRTPTLS